MAYRIGGPDGGELGQAPTWGRMRWPLVLNAFTWNASYTQYSRQWPRSEQGFGPVIYPKYFKWENGYLFRSPPFLSPPYYGISYNENPSDPGIVYTAWNVGMQYAVKSVDNNDFQPLIGEALDTDIGTFIITADAHSPTQGGQTLSDQPPGGQFIYGIGKLTGF